MARLEIPSIVVHKGGRSQSRPESPTVVCEGMPSLPTSRQGLAVSNSAATDSDMLDGSVAASNSSSPTSHSQHRPSPGAPIDAKSDTESKNYRNRANTKVKLLVRSHAMRESTSPPREPHYGSTSPYSPQPAEGEKKFASTNSLSPNSLTSSKQLNNNESMFSNSNLCPNQSPKQMRNSATSPTCRSLPRNGPSSPSQAHSPKNPVSPTNGKSENQRAKINNANLISKCNNCVKNSQNERPGLLQTPISPSKSNQAYQHSGKGSNLAQNNQKNSEQRRSHSFNCNNQCSAQCGNTLSVSRSNSRHKLRHQNSSQGSYDSASPSLSRDSSTELYTDSTGIDLEQFIAETINRNQKDRTVLLKIEKDLIEFAKDRQKVSHKFPNMSSYNRMLVHRVAAYFGMEHNVDQSGLSVIVTRTKNMRIPDTRFKEHIHDDLILNEEPRRSILKRDSSSFEDSFKSPDRLSGDYCRRSKSFEEREEEYERARRRIFKENSGESGDVTSWPYWSSSESSDASARYRLLHPSDHSARCACATSCVQTRLLKGESLDGRDSQRPNQRPSVSKSFSFGGYTRGMLSRGDSVLSTHSAEARLMKQDSGASTCSRLSPSQSSSGYKSQSQRSDATISPSLSPSPVPNATCGHSQISSQDAASPDPGGQTVVWAVTNISSVPPGSVIINPQNNQPYTNPDGSVYRFDPDNPPKLFVEEPAEGANHPAAPTEPSKSKFDKKRSAKAAPTTETLSQVSTTTTTTTVTNSSTSPSLPLPSPSPPRAPSPQQQQPAQQQKQSPQLQHQSPPMQHQQQPQQQQQQSQQHQHQQLPCATSQTLVRTATAQPCNHNQPAQPYATFLPTSEPFSPGVYPPSAGQQTVMMAPHPNQVQPSVLNNGQGDAVFNHNSVYANYTAPAQQQAAPPSGEVAELSSYFVGMNVYDQRGAGDSQSTPPHPYTQPPPVTNQTMANVQGLQPNYWQSPPNQMPPQQAMYFVPPPRTISVNQNQGERQQLSQQQRFATGYALNLQTMTPSTQSNSNYVSSYPVPYNSMQGIPSAGGDYACQPPVHMVPTYYPQGQPGIQPPPVMYRVPTPPSTPTSSQMPGVPLMYMNSGGYPPPTMMSTGSYGHQMGPGGTSPAPAGAYMTSALVPNHIFRQNVPLVTGVRASTPGSSQRASRSPTPAHEFFGCGSGDRNAQPPPRYPLPMYQGVHIVQGNPRLQYAPVPSPPVVQGCPRPYRPPSYASNASGCGTPPAFEGRNPKIRKPRSKMTTLPPTGARPNHYQVPSMSPLSSNAPKDIREGTVKVTITRRK